MKKIRFSIEQDGFYGTYYECPQKSEYVMIGLFGDDPNDYMAKCGAKWLHRNGVNVLAMSPGKKDYSHVNCPIERVENAESRKREETIQNGSAHRTYVQDIWKVS